MTRNYRQRQDRPEVYEKAEEEPIIFDRLAPYEDWGFEPNDGVPRSMTYHGHSLVYIGPVLCTIGVPHEYQCSKCGTRYYGYFHYGKPPLKITTKLDGYEFCIG